MTTASPAGGVGCLIVAGGRGDRLGRAQPKAFVEVAGQPMLGHVLQSVSTVPRVRQIVVVVPAGYESRCRTVVASIASDDRRVTVTAGGPTRQQSVAQGLAALDERVDVVLVHDAARCLAPARTFDAVIRAVSDGNDAVVPGMPLVDTVKAVDSAGVIVGTPDRATLRAVQTPQGFRRQLLERAHAEAVGRQVVDAVDDASLVEYLGVPVRMVDGDSEAFKITHPLDLVIAEALLDRRTGRAAAGRRLGGRA